MTRRLAVARSLAGLLVVALVVGPVGCGPAEPSTRSPTPEQDPERYDRARRAEEQAKRRIREAEGILMKKRRTKRPVKWPDAIQ